MKCSVNKIAVFVRGGYFIISQMFRGILTRATIEVLMFTTFWLKRFRNDGTP